MLDNQQDDEPTFCSPSQPQETPRGEDVGLHRAIEASPSNRLGAHAIGLNDDPSADDTATTPSLLPSENALCTPSADPTATSPSAGCSTLPTRKPSQRPPDTPTATEAWVASVSDTPVAAAPTTNELEAALRAAKLKPTLGKGVPQFRGWLPSFNISSLQRGETLKAPPPKTPISSSNRQKAPAGGLKIASAGAPPLDSLASRSTLDIPALWSSPREPSTGVTEQRSFRKSMGALLSATMSPRGRLSRSTGLADGDSSGSGVKIRSGEEAGSLPSSHSQAATIDTSADYLDALAPPMPIPKILAALGLAERDVCNIWVGGSRLWGCSTSSSDYDLYVVHRAKDSSMRVATRTIKTPVAIDASILHADEWAERLALHNPVWTFFCWHPAPWMQRLDPTSLGFRLVPQTLLNTMLGHQLREWARVRKYFNRASPDVASGRTTLTHLLRAYTLATQLCTHRRIIDFRAAEGTRRELQGFAQADWASWRDRFETRLEAVHAELRNAVRKAQDAWKIEHREGPGALEVS